jgi:hypothetical protein
MCCEECPRYDKCAEDDFLKDECCNRCPEYQDCMGLDDRDKDPGEEPYEEDSNEDERL